MCHLLNSKLVQRNDCIINNTGFCFIFWVRLRFLFLASCMLSMKKQVFLVGCLFLLLRKVILIFDCC